MLTTELFLADRHGRTFADVVNDSDACFPEVIEFFNDPDRIRRMEESETHHDRPALAGVIREFEALPFVRRFLETLHRRRSARFRQAVGVLVRMVMDGRGWSSTGKRGSLGVRAGKDTDRPAHNTGGLAFWFLRAERYTPASGTIYRSVREHYGKFLAEREQGSLVTPDQAEGKTSETRREHARADVPPSAAVKRSRRTTR